MRIIVRFTNGTESIYEKAVDCFIKDGFLHVIYNIRGKRKDYAFNIDNINEYQIYGGIA